MSPEQYLELQRESRENPEAFWSGRARLLSWQKPFQETLEWKAPFAKWFLDGQINASENCLDRHLTSKAHKTAIIWEGERGEIRTFTYAQLARQVNHLSSMLLGAGIQTGDRVAIYMPLIPEAAIAMLACARIGATHTVVFGGFSSEGLRDRILDSACKAVITADGGTRKGHLVPLKSIVDEALAGKACLSVEHVFYTRHAHCDIQITEGRDIEWREGESNWVKPVSVPATHPLFILYTSGTTGKPKGIVHGTGGYLTGVSSTFEWLFDVKDSDIYWCTADVGWITGHSYGVYGPLMAGATLFMYEGAPIHPSPDRFWEMIARHRISILYTAPTAIRMFMQQGDAWPLKHDLSSLRLLGSVGEPINPEAWHWYHEVIGQKRCPIVDTWWQTETGAVMISPIPGATSMEPGSATQPLPGIFATIRDGLLFVDKPWPSMMQGIWGDDQRYLETYWSKLPGIYFTGDGAKQDEQGNFWISGRVDDVLKIAGHRLGTYEVESSIAEHPAVAECAAIGKTDPIKGQAIVAFVALKEGQVPEDALAKRIIDHVGNTLGAFAKPSEIRFVPKLPKTRSGKVMRRLLRELVNTGTILGDTSTLEDT